MFGSPSSGDTETLVPGEQRLRASAFGCCGEAEIYAEREPDGNDHFDDHK
jgi:hypothetical protein